MSTFLFSSASALRALLAVVLMSTFALAAPPTVVVSTAVSPTGSNPIPVTITFDQAVSDLTAGELVVGGGTVLSLNASLVSGFAAVWTAQITPAGQGTITVTVPAGVTSNVGNEFNVASNTLSVVYDTPPVATIAVVAANLSGVTFRVTFDQDWSLSDVTAVVVRGAAVTSRAAVAGTPFATYDIVTVPYGSGVVTLALGAGAFRDLQGNPNAAVSSQATIGSASSGTEARVSAVRFVSPVDTIYRTGDTVELDVVFTRAVTVNGPVAAQPALALSSTGTSSATATARWQSTNGTTLRLRYAVLDGHASPALDYLSTTALTVADGGGLVGDDGFLALLALPATGSAASLRGSGPVGINFTVPKPDPDDVDKSNPPSNCGAGSGVSVLLGLLALAGLAQLVQWRRRGF